MQRKVWILIAVAGLLLVGAVGVITTGYTLDRLVIGPAQGSALVAEGYGLSGAAGQPAAGVSDGSPGGYQLSSGFWPQPAPAGFLIFLPLVHH